MTFDPTKPVKSEDYYSCKFEFTGMVLDNTEWKHVFKITGPKGVQFIEQVNDDGYILSGCQRLINIPEPVVEYYNKYASKGIGGPFDTRKAADDFVKAYPDVKEWTRIKVIRIETTGDEVKTFVEEV